MAVAASTAVAASAALAASSSLELSMSRVLIASAHWPATKADSAVREIRKPALLPPPVDPPAGASMEGGKESSKSFAPLSCEICTARGSRVMSSFRLEHSESAKTSSFERPTIANTLDAREKAADREKPPEGAIGLKRKDAVSFGVGGMDASSRRRLSAQSGSRSVCSSATSVERSPSVRIISCAELAFSPSRNDSLRALVAGSETSISRSALRGRTSIASPCRQRSIRPCERPSTRLTISTLSSRPMPRPRLVETANM